MDTDIFLNKKAIIERCLERVKEEYADQPDNLDNPTRQDSIVLNLQRMCEAAIDLAMHIISSKKLGLPQNSSDAFRLLVEASLLPESLGTKLKKMVGFRNIAIHDYQNLHRDILQKIIETHLSDFRLFLTELQKLNS